MKRMRNKAILSAAIVGSSLFLTGCETWEALRPTATDGTPEKREHHTSYYKTVPSKQIPNSQYTGGTAPQVVESASRTRYQPTRPESTTANVVTMPTSTGSAAAESLTAAPQEPSIVEDLLGDIIEPLPSESFTVSSTSSLSAMPESSNTSYTVKRGDSLWLISKRTGVPLTELMEENGLTKQSVLQVGQKLSIPSTAAGSSASAASSSEAYTVKRGDTLSEIAAATGISVSQLKQMNHLASNVIYVGQKLQVPAGSAEKVASKSVSTKKTQTAPITGDTHKVRSGETLSDIALASGMSVQELMQLNNIQDPRKLRAGQNLNITASAASKLASQETSMEEVEVAFETSPEAPVIAIQQDPENIEILDDEFFADSDFEEDLFGDQEEIPVISVDNTAS